jgi:hypothetical protein
MAASDSGGSGEGFDIRDYMARNSLRRDEYHTEFNKIFWPARLHDYWSNLTGFDIITFHEVFLRADLEVSTEAVVREKYGDRAVEVMQALLGADKEGGVDSGD